jgi:hypothetical protein
VRGGIETFCGRNRAEGLAFGRVFAAVDLRVEGKFPKVRITRHQHGPCGMERVHTPICAARDWPLTGSAESGLGNFVRNAAPDPQGSFFFTERKRQKGKCGSVTQRGECSVVMIVLRGKGKLPPCVRIGLKNGRNSFSMWFSGVGAKHAKRLGKTQRSGHMVFAVMGSSHGR